MTPATGMPGRIFGFDVRRTALAFICVAGLLTGNVLAQEPVEKRSITVTPGRIIVGKIDFPVDLIPKIPSSLRIVKLTSQAPPEAFLHKTLGKIGVEMRAIQPLAHAPHLASKGVSESLMGIVEHEQVHAYWDNQTGEAEIFPRFDKLRGERFKRQGDPHLVQAVSLAREVFSRPEILPHDVTQFTVGDAHAVLGATAQRDANAGSEQQVYLTYVPVFRTVNGYKVYGIGSRAVIAMANDGAIQGFLRRWKPGMFVGEVRETRTPAQVRAALIEMLRPTAKNADVQVLASEIAYYDSNEDSILPVYRVYVRVHPHSARAGQRLLSDELIARYMAFGNGRLPARLVQRPGPVPGTATAAPASKPEQRETPGGDPTVGRYVVRDSDWGFVDEANAFWNGLTTYGGSALFTNSQYYWAEPWMYTTYESSFMNSVNVALTEAHGSNWWFSTESNCCDPVEINNIPASQGYGAANGGHLAYWIIHSCAVIPSAEDNAAWWTPWFKVFQGLHSVVGSRTDMFFDSGAVNYPFGQNLRLGAPVVSAWFNATLSYYSGQPPVDRPSTISFCGHENDSVYNTASLPAAGCLINFWQPN
jgi:hypothetical protein